MSQIQLFTDNANVVISMLRTVAGNKGCNAKTVKNLLRALPSIPKNAQESGIGYFGEYGTADKALEAYANEAKKTTTDQSVAFGMAIDGVIKSIESVCTQLTDEHFETDRPGRSAGTTKVTFNGMESTTGEYFEKFSKQKVNDILNVAEADKTESFAKMLRYTAGKLKALADEILPPAKRNKDDDSE